MRRLEMLFAGRLGRTLVVLLPPMLSIVFCAVSGCDDDTRNEPPIDVSHDAENPDGPPIDVSHDASPSDTGDEADAAAPEHLAAALHPGGTLDLTRSMGRIILRSGYAEALVDVAGDRVVVSTVDGCDGEWAAVDGPIRDSAAFAATRGHRYTCEVGGIGLEWTVYVDSSRNTAFASVRIENRTGGEIVVLRLTPLMAEAPEGGLFVGDSLDRHRILDNGSDVLGDVDVRLHYPDEIRNALIHAVLDIPSRGNVVSNWNHAVVDLDTGASWVAGTLEVVHALPTMGLADYPSPVIDDDEGGSREGFGAFYADMALEFAGKPLPAGASLASETLYVDPMAPDPWTALEAYADAIAEWLEIELWTDRDGGRPVPNGWNSWTGSGGTGGLGTNIDEALMLEELEVMARELAPFGIDYFQIDDGYQVVEGDWQARPDRFPSGMPALSAAIEEAGLIPGIWISAFLASVDSSLAAEHPDWLCDPDDNVTMGLFAPGDDLRALDLSNDAVVEWLSDTMRRYRDDWGMGWLKLDFGYFAALYLPRANSDLTAMETYRRGIEAVGEALGDDVFYMGIGMMGVNYGVVDTMRLTLDNGPLWEEHEPFALFGQGNNFKNGVRVAARRYYLNHRVWISHNDLLFFRTDPNHPDEPVTLDEAITLASFMGLSGAIVKFGEDLRTLTAEQIDVWRRLLPIYPAGARPMDLFTRLYPEEYLLEIDGTLAGSDARWWVVGLLNWGRNYDYTGDARATMPDEARTYTVDLGEWGVDPDTPFLAQELWSETFLGVVEGELVYEVPAHGHAVIALRPATGRPQLLGHNRHITQGATDLVAESWSEEDQALSVSLNVDAAGEGAVTFEYRLWFYVPEDYALGDVEIEGGDVSQQGPVVTLAFTPEVPGQLDLTIPFE